MPRRHYFGVPSDIYALGVVLWCLAVQSHEPHRYGQSRGTMAMARDDNFEPDALTWGIPVRSAIECCLNTRPSHRPSTELLLRVLKEDALNDDDDPEPLDAIVEPTLPHSVAV